MTATYPNLLASGVDEDTAFSPFELFAGESDIVTNQATAAASLVTLISANEQTFGVSASASSGVVTLTALEAGPIANTLTVAKSGTNIAVGGATLAGGTSGKRAFAIAAQAIAAGTMGPIYTGGVFNHEALLWPAGVSSLAARKAAFDGTDINIGAVL